MHNFQTIRRIKKQAMLYVRNFAIDAGCLMGHKEYTRFVVLGSPRTGSNFLCSAINTHSQITAFGELFRWPGTIGWDLLAFRYWPYGQSENSLNLIRSEPIEFLKTQVFKAHPKCTASVGFKLFYFHAREGNWKRVWNYLANEKNLRIIHLKRKNLLGAYLSHQRALLTNKWVYKSKETPINPPMKLDPRQCSTFFKETREWERQCDIVFRDHPKIEIFYEQLSNNFRQTIFRIQKFLGVNYEKLVPATYKQARLPLSIDIENYLELKEDFQGTRWAVFFEE
jgi:LPS sulfotransferase NodH